MNASKQTAIVQLIGGQYETYVHAPVTVKFTTRAGLLRRMGQLRKENATYGDNFAGWIEPLAIASLGETQEVEVNNFYGSQTAVIPASYKDEDCLSMVCHDAQEYNGYLICE
jgi:hypothetical protein